MVFVHTMEAWLEEIRVESANCLHCSAELSYDRFHPPPDTCLNADPGAPSTGVPQGTNKPYKPSRLFYYFTVNPGQLSDIK